MTRNIMTKKLVERGFQKGRKHSGVVIHGLRLGQFMTTPQSAIPCEPEESLIV